MEPIISPWLIYFIGVSDSIVRASGMVAFISALILVVVLGFYMYHEIESSYTTGREKEMNVKLSSLSGRASKFLGIVFAVSFFASVFTPDKNTLISMVVANIVTVDNIQGANEFVKTNVQDYINMLTDAINKVK